MTPQMDFSIQRLDVVRATTGGGPVVSKADAVVGTSFKDAIKQALQATSDLQAESGRLSKEFALENPTVSLEQVMVAGVKSTVAFQATIQMRNRVVQAYTDIMNMQI